MAKFKISFNMEFCRSADKGFEAGVKIASESDTGVSSRWSTPGGNSSVKPIFHSTSLEEDPLLIKEICDRHGIKYQA